MVMSNGPALAVNCSQEEVRKKFFPFRSCNDWMPPRKRAIYIGPKSRFKPFHVVSSTKYLVKEEL